MRRLYPSELQDIVKELKRQKMIEQYAEQKNKWAFLAAVITNGFASIAGMFSRRKPKMIEADAFLSKNYKKAIVEAINVGKTENRYAKLIQEAKQKGLYGPW